MKLSEKLRAFFVCLCGIVISQSYTKNTPNCTKQNVIILLLLTIILASCSVPEPRKTEIIHSNWQFSNAKDNVWHSATVPGVIHTDLLANKLIEDPYWGTNELTLRWIDNEYWNYTTEFEISKDQLNQEHIELEFEGLDTYATVIVNGTEVIIANNMFRSWKVDIKEFVKKGNNLLEVKFTSPLNYNRAKVENYPHQLPAGNETVDLKVSPFTRKAAYHFGWDWGPRFVTSGIWKNVNLITWNEARVLDAFVQTDSIINDIAYLTYEVEIEASSKVETGYSLLVNGLEHFVRIEEGENTWKFQETVENPKLWWPNGMGEATLHNLVVQLKKDHYLIDEINQNYGIRTVELINEKDSIGTSFYFKVNGMPVFMKGANYIPQDVFLPRVSEDQYIKLIKQVKDANMNMLRVWGGGIYEKDIFYDLCDQNGILVWQDFMFAGSLYPNDSAFLENVKQEAIENVVRLRKHPSIALWCGNNEIEVAWGNWGWQNQYGYSSSDSIEIWDNYRYMFQSLLPEIVSDLNPTVNYVSTSPLSNWGTPENFNHSSMHYWGVWHGRELFNNFKTNVGRFMVEYGFQSFPSMETIRKFAADSSFSLQSTTMLNRQKSYIGNGLITNHINNWFDAPTNFTDFIEKSQKTQAIGMQMAIQAHRQQSPQCMGTLFWQLNDCWPGPSWSVIDYYGNEKVAYETVKQNFKSLIAKLDFENNEIEVISDLPQKFKGKIEVILDSEILFYEEFSIEPNSRLKIDFSKAILKGKSPLTIIITNEASSIICKNLVYQN